jgi:hypothetical protein
VTIDGQFAKGGINPAGTSLQLQVTGRGGVPAGATAVVMNVTVVQPSGDGYVTVYPCGQAVPNASNLNYTSGQIVPNLVTVKVGDGGKVCLYSMTATHLIADVTALYPASTSLTTLSNPARLLDTRPSGTTFDGQFAKGGANPAGASLQLEVAGRGGIPGDASAVVLNVTATEPSGAGYVTVYPCGQPRPNASNLNYTSAQTVPNLVVAKIGDGGKVCLYSMTAAHLIADVAGYYPAIASLTLLAAPARVLDTRADGITIDGQFAKGGANPAGASLQLQVGGRAGAPATPGIVVLNVTVTEPTASGYVTVYPCGQPVPNASNLNYTAGQTVPNLVIAKPDATGKVCLYSITATHLVADLAAYQPG